MTDKPKKKQKKYNLDHLDFHQINVSSSMDCTGLIPATPESDEELDSYRELYDNGTIPKK